MTISSYLALVGREHSQANNFPLVISFLCTISLKKVTLKFQLNLNLPVRLLPRQTFLKLKIRSNIYDPETQNGHTQTLYVQHTQPVNLN